MARVQVARSVAIATVMWSASAQAQVAPDDIVKASVQDADDNSADIIVTASKRNEKLQDVPAAITALTGSQLETLNVKSFRDYASLVPGLSQRDSGAPGLGTIIIRGLNTGPQQTTNTTAYYIDDTPFSASGFLSIGSALTPEPELVEIERVEVLKGPQGTLYGASSLGGLIHLVTKRPDLTRMSATARGEITATAGGDLGYLVRAAVNAPLITDKLAISATGYYRKLGGFADNVTLERENVNESRLAGGRVALRFKPSSALTMDLSGLYQDIDSDDFAYQALVPGTNRPLFGADKFASSFEYGSKLRYRIVDGNISYTTDIGTITGLASYGYYRAISGNDVTSTYLGAARATLRTQVSRLFPGQTVDTILPVTSRLLLTNSPGMKKFSSELRFTSNRLGPFEFIVGGFYTDERNRYPAFIYNYNAALQLSASYPVVLTSTTLSNYKEYAGFGDVTIYLTERFDITGGIRHAYNKQQTQIGGPGAVTYYIPRATSNFPSDDAATTYLATARWRPIGSLSFYLRAASGYRPGGPQTNPAPPAGAQTVIDPDNVWNYEAGVKGSALNGAFTFGASAFHIDWSDIQLNALANGILLQGNGGRAKVDGGELEFTARPGRNTVVSATFGYTNARITAITAGTAAVLGARVGDKLPLTPPVTAAVLADQTIELGNSVAASFGGTIRFQSDMPNSYGAQVGSARLPDITTGDLRARLTLERITFDAVLANITNERAISQVSAAQAVLIRPRTFTFGAGVKF